MKRTFYFLIGLFCVSMLALPIVALIAHAHAVDEAEAEWNRQEIRHRKEMNRIIKDAHERSLNHPKNMEGQ